MIVDAHHHLWNYSAAEYPWIPDAFPNLQADQTAADFAAVAEPLGIAASVAVQARQSLEETDWLLSVAAADNPVAGVVGWAPLASSSVGDDLADRAADPHLVGIRHVVQDEPDGFLDNPAFNAGVRELGEYGLAYDLLIYGRQLDEAIRFVDRHPELTIVLDHLAKPTITPGTFDSGWAERLRKLAKRPNVSCKLSGMANEVTVREWAAADLRPYLEVALEAFGIDRVMYGSDWPVCLMATTYRDWFDTVAALAASLSDDERAKLWGGNAVRTYGLAVSPE